MSAERKALKNELAPQIYSEVFKKQVVKEFEQGLFTKANFEDAITFEEIVASLVG